ncbi:hypothetical protein BDV93DRAFT_14533 [Ceratobasidium sp. AG-I]|nr:hypothetical protein BDV93DRAFT_14533 [Ceratobasidium sp. AG-I]
MSQSRHIVEITKDTLDLGAYLERLIEIIGIAFRHSPLTLPALGASYDDNPQLYNRFSRAQLQAAFTGAGRVFGAFVDGMELKNLVGCAIWYEPGKEFLDDEVQLSYWNEFLTHLDLEVKRWWDEEMLPAYRKLTRDGLGEGTKKGLLHLSLLGVHPDFQRKGLGIALVRHMLDPNDAKGAASCVETTKPSNVAFYKALGYEVKAQTLVSSPHGDVTMWSFYREPPNMRKV